MGKSNSLEDIAVGFDDEACLEIDNIFCLHIKDSYGIIIKIYIEKGGKYEKENINNHTN